MKPSHLLFAAVGYALGARAGRERWESIVRLGRRVTGSQTVQATAGVVQAQVGNRVQRARDAMSGRPVETNRSAAKPMNGAGEHVNR